MRLLVLLKKNISHALSGRDLFESHTSTHAFVHMPQAKNSINSRELVLEAHSYTALVSHHGGIIFVTFVYSRIFIFLYFDNDSEGDQYLDWRF